MEYKCQTVNMSRLIIGPQGYVKPLCDSCKSRDCSNPVEKMKISILGVSKEVRIFNQGVDPSFVVQCEGYLS